MRVSSCMKTDFFEVLSSHIPDLHSHTLVNLSVLISHWTFYSRWTLGSLENGLLCIHDRMG